MSHKRTLCFAVVLLAIGASDASQRLRAQDSAQQQPMPSAMPAVMAAPLEKSRAAIEECRERRLRGELVGYKQSAECSSPRIFAAWREANYPHMDLITDWLNARETLSGQVDQKTITPRQFQEQMAAVTNRLTAEEQRRRAGLLNTADNTLELQLPPSTQVVGVATAPGQEKSAKKKAAAARAASLMPPMQPSAGTSVQSMTSLSNLDSQKPQAGTGGPLVPVPARIAEGFASAPGASGLYAHLSSQRSEAEAQAAFRMLQQQYPNILGGRDAVVHRADVGGQGGTCYRAEIGPLPAEQVNALCNSLKAAGGQCVARYE